MIPAVAAASPPPIAQIAARAEREERGVVLYRLHRSFDVHAGPMHRHDELVLAIVSEDGRVVKVRVLQAAIGGKPADAQASAQIENQYERPAPADVFHRPFDPKYVGEYTFQPIDAVTYRFTSLLRDSAHGDGTMTLDQAGDVVKYQYTPNALPRYATSGTVTCDRAQVLPDYWFLTREYHEYRGHYAIFGGGATADIRYDSFVRYPDLPAATSALERMSAPPSPNRGY